jgi:class 3 adenylate cyclase
MMNTSGRENILYTWSFKSLYSWQIAGRIIFVVMIISSLTVGSFYLWVAVKRIDKPFAGFNLNRRMVVLNIGQYHWTGTKAGLKYPDKVLKANGKEVSSYQALRDMIYDMEIGEPVRYAIDRDGQQIELIVPTMRFTGTDLFVTTGFAFSQALIYLMIGIVVFVLKPDIKISWITLLICFFLSLSLFSIFEMELRSSVSLMMRIFISSFMPALIMHFSLLFPEKLKLIERRLYIQIIPYIISLALFIPIVILYPNPLFILFYKVRLVYTILSLAVLIVSILRAYFKKSSALARQRAKVVLFGAALAFPIPSMALLIVAMGWNLWEMKINTNYTSMFILIFPMSVAYAIAKHNLFDVDVYIKRAVGYAIMTIIVGSVYFSMQLIIRNVILGPLFGVYAEKMYPIVFALLVVFFFNPINQRVQGIVDRLFYRKKFDYKDTVLSVSNALTSVLNIDEIIKRIIHTLKKEMFIDNAGVILLEPHKECKAMFVSDNPDHSTDSNIEQCLPYDDPLVTLVSQEKRMITEYDIEEDPRYKMVRESCSQRFSEMGASVTLPLTYRGSVTGILALGNKKSGHFYSREDIHLLETLTNQSAVAIENAKLAEQMKKEETVRTNLARYLSPQIVDDIVKNDVQVNLGGDRKTVTVLFSDIRNFTTITESRPAEQLVTILNEYFTEMADIIFECQGSLDKYIGDALVAVFGSLIEVENPVQNAVQAAVKMMKRMPDLNERWTKEYGFSMHQGIGINTGNVFLGNIGSRERMEFTVIGDTVNVSSRFSGLAKAGQILLTREAFDFIAGSDINYKELPPSKVKGKSEELEVFEVLY